MALIASAETTAPTLTPQIASTANVHHETREFTLPEEGKAHVVETTESTGTRGAGDRRGYASSDKTKYKENYENYVKEYYVANALEKLDVGDPHDLTKPFHVAASVTKSQSGVIGNSSGEVIIPTQSLAQNLPTQLRDFREQTAEAEQAKPSKKRVHDFVFTQPSVTEWTYRIKLPAGFAPRTLPQNEHLQLGSATFTSDYKTDADGTIVATVRLDSGKRRLTAAEFEETRKAVSKFTGRAGIRIGFDSIGQAKLNAGDVRSALAEFHKLAALHPKEAQHHIELARALLAGGLGEAAREEAKLAVTVEPSNAKAHEMLAAVLEHDLIGRKLHRGCDIPGAIAELRKAKQLESTNALYRGALAELLTYGDDDAPFGRNAHLKEAADEYASLVKELGKDGKGYEPPLMLVYAYMGKWNDIQSSLDKIEDERQRELFRLMATTVLEGNEAGLRALNAYDAEKRRAHGTAVAATFLRLRMYPQCSAFFDAATQGSPNASQLLPFLQILSKTKRIEELPEDPGPRGVVMKVAVAAVNDDEAAVRKLYVPEIANRKNEEDGKHAGAALRSAIGDLPMSALIDMVAAMIDVQQDGNDETGYRLRLRMTGSSSADSETIYVVKRDGKYLIAGESDPEDTLGISVLKLADEGKLDAARTWLNWARESISAGGGDDPLSGPPFARLWSKEKQTATADEIRAAAASLMLTKESAADAAPVLEAVRAKTDREETKTAIDVALAIAYHKAKDWTKLLPVAERLAKVNPDSGSAFRHWDHALARLGRADEARKLANERLARMPKDHDALVMLSYVSAWQSDYEAASTWARKIVNDLTPDAGDYNHAAWLALFRGKDFDQAIDDARKAAADNTWETLHTLAALYAETGKSAEARQALLQGMERRFSDQPSSGDWFVLGRIAENYGVKDAAVVAYKKVKQDDADGISTWDLAQKRIAQLK
jgi:tetratricopeptide (TPR) repeat protein